VPRGAALERGPWGYKAGALLRGSSEAAPS
jgi:hypothetical protein